MVDKKKSKVLVKKPTKPTKSKPKIVVNKVAKHSKTKNNVKMEEAEVNEENNALIDLSIEILQNIDPDQSMSKDQVMKILLELQENTTDLLRIEAIGYLLNQLENIEEKLEHLEEERVEYVEKIKGSIPKLEDETFKAKIDLTPDEKADVAECEQILIKAKEVYGAQKKYMKPKKVEVEQFKSKVALRRPPPNIKKAFDL